MAMLNTDGRHESTRAICQFLEPNPRLEGMQRDIATKCADLAALMLARLPDGPELTTGLRKLLEAKDCFVRQSVVASDEPAGWSALRT